MDRRRLCPRSPLPETPRRLFHNAKGNYINAPAYGISFWLASGVDPAECARRAGQSMKVLFRHYAKFLAEARDHANRLIEDSMRRW
ncbi:hypothetical protein GCM10010232_39680 [Streptomyces amakusaensis]|uniref:Integrase n=1 Tax=Streptomyces amakusaensis TaxID=67271 RepID=A0ABW0AJM9_9ACTN